MVLKFRNAHAIVKAGKPFKEPIWLCDLDDVKRLDVGPSYRSDKSARTFRNCIPKTACSETAEVVQKGNFFSFTIDGATDFTGDDYENIRVRTAHDGKAYKSFLLSGCPSRLQLLIFMSM